MNTGCNGPFKRGTGGTSMCGCNCKCCPPTCSGVVSVFFDCGGPESAGNPLGCDFTTPSFAMGTGGYNVPAPTFTKQPILSRNKDFSFGQAGAVCTIPCQTICVPVKCGGNECPCCCIEICNGTLLSVGNGFVTAPATVEIEECLTFTVFINGSPPPVFVNDGCPIVVTLVADAEEECCCCEQISVAPGCCPTPAAAAIKGFGPVRRTALIKRKIDLKTGKVKINPKTGKPIIVMDKMELIRRIIARKRNLKRK